MIRTWDGRHAKHVGRILKLYRSIDRANEELAARGHLTVSCRAGCAACCSQWVGVWYLEALICVAECERTGFDLSIREMQNQAALLMKPGVTRDGWFGLGNRCIFLRSDNLCGVHSARPLACRALNVVSDPKNCKSATGTITRVNNRPQIQEAYRRIMAEHAMAGLGFVVAALPVMVNLVLGAGKPSDLTLRDGVYGLGGHVSD